MIKRYQDWERRLSEWVESVDNMPFEWGTHDCILSACNAVLAITGYDLAYEFRGKYNDEAGAREILSCFHDGKVSDIASVYALGNDLQQIGSLEAQRGDVLLFDWGEFNTLSICVGSTGLCPGIKRAHYIGINRASCAWRIGN